MQEYDIASLLCQCAPVWRSWETRGNPGALLFLSDVKARHDKMVGLVERMMTAEDFGEDA
jgi:hypothetical protein